jgi:hypothetical protein
MSYEIILIAHSSEPDDVGTVALLEFGGNDLDEALLCLAQEIILADSLKPRFEGQGRNGRADL